MRNIKNIIYHTFIGLKAKIVNSASIHLIGFEGIIVDETKNMLVFETKDGKEKRIQKKPNIFRIYLEDGNTIDINGAGILFRHYERAKKVKKRIAVVGENVGE